jgi:hypothetical protein
VRLSGDRREIASTVTDAREATGDEESEQIEALVPWWST